MVALRQRVEDGFFAANAETAFLVGNGDRINARHVHCDAVGRFARAPFIGVAYHEGVQARWIRALAEEKSPVMVHIAAAG